MSKLTPVINADKRIQNWRVDLNKPGMPLTVTGDINEHEVITLVEKAGYKASALQLNETAHCEMPHNGNKSHKGQTMTLAAEHTPVLPANPFWTDSSVWKRASFNTFSCLIGCSIGDFAMIIFLQAYYPGTPMMTQMVLAIVAGLFTSVLLETTLMRYRERLSWGLALKMAFSMSFLSMIGMEIAMNLTDFMITGGKMALSNPAYWLAFIPAALAGFLAPLPYNYYQLKKHNKACH
ncbi:MAG TPA: DUF4396 domain-containing protein [Bacteroidia bacterium]|nr:DUF4396 domain-containing protein [Bacteroidia bacterium]